MSKSVYTNYEQGLREEAIDYGIRPELLESASPQDLELFNFIEGDFRQKDIDYPNFFSKAEEISGLGSLVDSLLASPSANNPNLTVRESLQPLYEELLSGYGWEGSDFYNSLFNRYRASTYPHRNVGFSGRREEGGIDYIYPAHLKGEGVDTTALIQQFDSSLASTILDKVSESMSFRRYPSQDVGPYWNEFGLRGKFDTGVYENPDTISFVSEEDFQQLSDYFAEDMLKMYPEGSIIDPQGWKDEWSDDYSKKDLTATLFHELFHGTGLMHREGWEQDKFMRIFDSAEFQDIFSDEDRELIWNTIYPGPAIPEIPHEQRGLY